MGTSRKTTTRRAADPARARVTRHIALHVGAALLVVLGLAAAFYFARRYVERKLAFPSEPPKVVLTNRPPWMSDLLAQRIAASVRPAGAHSSFDHHILVDIDHMLRLNPWIRTVRQVRRGYARRPGDTLEIDCDYRAPVALVKTGSAYWLVDNSGVKLPERFAESDIGKIVIGTDRKVNIRVIEGVRRAAPREAGQKWVGDDLAAGLEMVRTLSGLPYAEEIHTINVSNFAGREDPKEAHITLLTRYKTAIRWGRPKSDPGNFIEVSAEVKLQYMKKVFEEYGRVDANHPWIDIRFDKITYPSAGAAGAQADVRQ